MSIDNLQEVVSGRLSILGRRWLLRQSDEVQIKDISRRYDLGDNAAGLLVGRGVEDIENFLQPTLKHYLTDPYNFIDMEKAVERVVAAIKSGESIILYGDYDVDGACSVALLQAYLLAVGHDNFRIYIPDRYEEGYGVNESAIDILASENHKLMICMDCGTSSHGALSKAKACGLDVIVLDHHKPDSDVPDAFALVNPNLASNDSFVRDNFGILAAVGVSYLFLIGLGRLLREQDFFTEKAEPDLLLFLDLVALGTVCDVVPLRGLNRAFVFQGLKILNRKNRVGLRALCDVCKVGRVDSGDLGFQLGPRLNAGSRMGDSGLAAKLLCCVDEDEALVLAWRLDRLNIERRVRQSEQMSEVIHSVRNYLSGRNSVNHILVSGDGWHSGFVGILAGRVKEQFCYPSIVIGFDGDIGRGSGRSVSGIDLGSVIISAYRAGLLVSGGGHAMAAGLTIMRDRLDDFGEFLSSHISAQLGGGVISPDLLLDFELSLSSVTGDFIGGLDILSPYGNEHVLPLPLFRGVRVRDVHLSKDGVHVFCRLYDGSGIEVRGVIFDGVNHILGGILLGADSGDEFDIVGRLSAPFGGARMGSVIIEDLVRL